ncbi:phosphatase PAP2 family protein, partial [Amnibacterium sp.]|uniref:phosphatase PAP2 family protein n=1 Tax=Amnibacterium sp. TaxID=1872496 RepID=UPI00262E13C8
SAPVPWLARRVARRLALWATGGLAGCWLVGAAVSWLPSTPGIGLDAAARAALQPLSAVAPIDAVAQFLAVIGEQPVSIVVAVGVALAVVVRWGLQAGVAFGLASALSAGSVILMKSLVQRPGPVTAFFEGLGSFPSGHAANAAVLATLGGLLLRRRWAWIAGGAYVGLVAASRVVVGAHWFTDTVVGAVAGASVALLVWSVWSLVRGRGTSADA